MRSTRPRLVLISATLMLPIWTGCDAGSEAPRVPPFSPADAATEARIPRPVTPATPSNVKLRAAETPRE